MYNKKKAKYSKSLMNIITLGIIVMAISGVILATIDRSQNTNKGGGRTEEEQTREVQTVKTGDLIIPVADVTNNASFYGYEIDGTKLEVIAIKASDGSIRTAFNTCQVCYGSGKGYYKQEGDYLVCQNCGNRFKASDVEIAKGGCNPVPIFSENKTVDETNITISKDFLKDSKGIFENWKS